MGRLQYGADFNLHCLFITISLEIDAVEGRRGHQMDMWNTGCMLEHLLAVAAVLSVARHWGHGGDLRYVFAGPMPGNICLLALARY